MSATLRSVGWKAEPADRKNERCRRVWKRAVLGTGVMGKSMAGHLINNGYTLLVHNRTAAKADDLVKMGATYCEQPQDVAKEADFLFLMLGFPSDDFWQELDSNQEIKEFCKGYQISFPLFAEGPVRGSDKQEVFRFLTEQPSHDGEIWWNFEKFLINRDGKLVDRYRSGQDPDEDPLLAQIESLL